MPFHKEGAYDGFDRLNEVRQYYKRCRRQKHFILSNDGVKTDKPVCVVCNNLITTQTGNRCQYHPKFNKIACMHYNCAWNNLLHQVFNGVNTTY